MVLPAVKDVFNRSPQTINHVDGPRHSLWELFLKGIVLENFSPKDEIINYRWGVCDFLSFEKVSTSQKGGQKNQNNVLISVLATNWQEIHKSDESFNFWPQSLCREKVSRTKARELKLCWHFLGIWCSKNPPEPLTRWKQFEHQIATKCQQCLNSLALVAAWTLWSQFSARRKKDVEKSAKITCQQSPEICSALPRPCQGKMR